MTSLRTLHCRMKPYIQPFERKLGLAEMKSLCDCIPVPLEDPKGSSNLFCVHTETPLKELARRLSYWESVSEGQPMPTRQVLREASVNAVRNGLPLDEIHAQLPLRSLDAIPNRRCLRYGPHGIHEYRGKFFPQLVVSLINMAKVPKRGVVRGTFARCRR